MLTLSSLMAGHALYMASLMGWGNLDDSIMIKLMEKIAGLDKEA